MSRASSIVLMLTAACILSGCSSSHFVQIDDDSPFGLSDGEAIIVMQIDTELPLKKWVWTGLVTRRAVPKGRATLVARVPAGRYRWFSVEVENEAGFEANYRLKPNSDARRQELDLDIRPGMVNYAGSLWVRKASRGHYFAPSSIYLGVQNHVAAALRFLERNHPGLLERYELHDALSNRDEFLEYYIDARERRGPPRRTTKTESITESIDESREEVHEPRRGLPAELLFAADGIHDVRVSPDGQWLAATAHREKVQGLLAQRIGGAGVEALTQTHADSAPIAFVRWVGNDTLLAQLGWTGRFRKFLRVDFAPRPNGRFVSHSTGFQMRGWVVSALPEANDEILWAVERRERSTVYRVRLDELIEFEKDFRNWRRPVNFGRKVAEIDGSVVRWIVDRQGVPRAAVRAEENSFTVFFREDADASFRPIANFDPAEFDLVDPYGFTDDQSRLIVKGYNGHDTVGIWEFDPRVRRFGREIFRRDDVDIEEIEFDPLTHTVGSFTYSQGSEMKRGFLPDTATRFVDKLGTEDPPIDDVRIVSASLDQDRFVYWNSNPTEPGAHHLRVASTGETQLLGRKAGKIDREKLSPVQSFDVTSRDGTVVEALITLPVEKTDRPAPLLAMPHGGPLGVHDRQVYDPLVQYFASWGFAVLQVNYRGSSGYGEEFEKAGRKQWARAIEDDIDAAIESAMGRPDVDGERICIIGGSYGGFSAIASVLRHPKRFACAVTINGVSDVPFQSESADYAYTKGALRIFSRLIGDPKKERDRLLEISPVYHLEDVETPVMVVYGNHDRRVDPDHAHRVLLVLELFDKPREEIQIGEGRHTPTPAEWTEHLPSIRRFLSAHLDPDAEFVPDSRRAPDTFSYDLQSDDP